jgi:hypothetical protein
MRTLTQVWVFLVGLTFLFLVLGFQLLGRPGLFFMFLVGIAFLYAALHRSLSLFRGRLRPEEYCGNDPTGFIGEIEANKVKFGLRKITVHLTKKRTPPLVWQDTDVEGHIILNDQLLDNLSKSEVRLLALLTLSHLENRSFVLSHLLSILKGHIPVFAQLSSLFATVVNSVFKTQNEVTQADLKFKALSEVSEFEVGYFLNKMHRLSFNQNQKPDANYFFSVLSLPQKSHLNEYGLPELDSRLKKMMGFTL